MRLLTHNTMRNNAQAASGKGFPLKITAIEIKVVDNLDPTSAGYDEIAFVEHVLPTLEWPALVQAADEMGISTLPTTLTESLVEDRNFLKALYQILMNVHLVRGMLTCPETGREFPVTDGIPNMVLDEEECEKVRL